MPCFDALAIFLRVEMEWVEDLTEKLGGGYSDIGGVPNFDWSAFFR